MNEIYLSLDCESSGPVPGRHSLMSLGAIALTAEGRELDTFYANLAPLLGATTDPNTQKWWDKHPEARAATETHVEMPDAAMSRFYWWVKGLQGNTDPRPKVVPVCFGLGYDGLFFWYYLLSFGERKSPFTTDHAFGLDIKSMAFGMRPNTTFWEQGKRGLPKEWKDGLTPHDHHALHDAREQGELFMRMLLDRDGPEGE